MPNITGSYAFRSIEGALALFNHESGCFSITTHDEYNSYLEATAGAMAGKKHIFDASGSNSIYGNSTHVTPETVAVLFGVYAVGTVVSIGEATEEGILAELGNINNQLTNLNTTYVRTIDHHEAVDNNVTVLDTYNVVNPVTPGTDTVEDWQALGSGTYWFNNNNTDTGYPESQYGFIINIRGDEHNDIFQIWKPQREQKPYYRGGNANGWSAWNMFGGSASLVATYSSGTNWYRKWSDGWIEQGGTTQNVGNDSTVTVSCITAFTTTNYNIVASQKSSGTKTDSTGMVLLYPTSTSSWYLHNGDNVSAPFMWYACGY